MSQRLGRIQSGDYRGSLSNAASESTVRMRDWSASGLREKVTSVLWLNFTSPSRFRLHPLQVLVLLGIVLNSGCVTVFRDGDRDGFAVEVDCDDTNAEIGGPDLDGDGHNCKGLGGDDCDETDPTIYSGSEELCDGIVNDCDHWSDNDQEPPIAELEDFEVVYVDADGDGYGGPYATSVRMCEEEPPWIAIPGDCNDQDIDIHPGAIESCDSVDNNCDGKVDESPGQPEYHRDADGDGYGGTERACEGTDGAVDNDDDCDDHDNGSYPDAPEICDAQDNDCDREIDEGVSLTVFVDSDADGYGDEADHGQAACNVSETTALEAGDCDDLEPAINPGTEEVCDTVDNDCNGDTDELVQTAFYKDEDGDGYGDSNDSILACSRPSGYTEAGQDCVDTDAAVNPHALETCNGSDDDCDHEVDEGTRVVLYADRDDDGYGAKSETVMACSGSQGLVSDSTDCDDLNNAIHPHASELCNGVDDNCNTSIDEDLKTTYYLDVDQDGYGDPNNHQESCTQPEAYSSTGGDCDDEDPLNYPGATDLPGSPDGWGCTTHTDDWQKAVAGGFTGDGSSATLGFLNNVYAMATDSAGNLFLSTYPSNRIRYIQKSNMLLSTLAGSGVEGTPEDGSAIAAKLNLGPHTPSRSPGLASFSASQLFFTDQSGLWELNPSSGTLKSLVPHTEELSYGSLSLLNFSGSPVLFVLDINLQTPTKGRVRTVSWVNSNLTQTDVTTGFPLNNAYAIAASARVSSASVWVGSGVAPFLQRIPLDQDFKGTPISIDVKESDGVTQHKGVGVVALAVKEESSRSLVYLVERENDGAQRLVKLAWPLNGNTATVLSKTELPLYAGPHSIVLGDAWGYDAIVDYSESGLYGWKADTGTLTHLAGLSEEEVVASNREGSQTMFEHPWGVAIEGNSLYVSEFNGVRLRGLSLPTDSTPSATKSCSSKGTYGYFTGSPFGAPKSIAAATRVDGSTAVYIADYNSGKIFEMTGFETSPDSPALRTVIAGLSYPTSVFAWVDPEGEIELLIAEEGTHCIRQVFADGTLGTFAGLPDTAGTPTSGPLSGVRFTSPTDVTASLIPSGLGYRLNRVFVSSDTRILEISDNYVQELYRVGDYFGPWLEYAWDPSLGDDVLYFSSDTGYVARMSPISSTGVIEIIAGDAPDSKGISVTGDLGDGPAETQLLGSPRDLALDVDTGVLYVADYGANKVWRLVP